MIQRAGIYHRRCISVRTKYHHQIADHRRFFIFIEIYYLLCGKLFERHFRVHMNTQEQLLMFLPSLWIFAHYISALWAAALGVVFVIGRAIYATSYVRDPKSRALGFALTAFPTFAMMIGIVIGTASSILVACPLLTLGVLRVTKQDLLPKARDEAALARRP